MLIVTNVSGRTLTLENPSSVKGTKSRYKTSLTKEGVLSMKECSYQEYDVVTLQPGEVKKLPDQWENCPIVQNSIRNRKSPMLRVKRS